MKTTFSINNLIADARDLNLHELQKQCIKIYDIFDQAITKHIEENNFWDSVKSISGASYSAKGRCLKKHLENKNHKAISDFVDTARYCRYGKEDLVKLNKFLNATSKLSDLLSLSDLEFHLRIPIGNTIVNTTTVENPKGFKTINLLHTDLGQQKTDLLILTTTSKNKPSGLFFDRLKEHCNFEVNELTPFHHFDNEIFSSLLTGNEKTGFKYLLVLNLPARHDNETMDILSSWLDKLILS